MVKTVYTTNNRRKNEKLVNVTKSGLNDLKKEIEKMSDDETEIEKPVKVVDIVEKINRQNQELSGLKILTSDQMLRRLQTTLVQSKAGNNSEKN